MEDKNITVYVASSVGIDYFYFLQKTIAYTGSVVKSISLISEAEYRKQARSSGPTKLWLRLKMYLVYPLFLLYTGITCKSSSIFVVSSNTFYAPYLVRKLLRYRGIKVVHMLYDLYPDALEIAGGFSHSSIISKLIGWIAKGTQSECDGTVYLGEYLKSHAESRWGSAVKSDVIDISTDLSQYNATFQPLPVSGPIIIHYGGQLGHLHDAQSIISCVRMICHSDLSGAVKFIFYTSGAQAKILQQSLADYPVDIISTAPSTQWRNDIRSFHIGLVSLSPGGATVCLPSKTYALMAGGLAILTIAPLWSDLSSLVQTLDAGWVINNSRYKTTPITTDPLYLNKVRQTAPQQDITHQFYLTIGSILNDRKMLEDKRRNAFFGIRKHYGIQNLSQKWDKLLADLSSQQHSAGDKL